MLIGKLLTETRLAWKVEKKKKKDRKLFNGISLWYSWNYVEYQFYKYLVGLYKKEDTQSDKSSMIVSSDRTIFVLVLVKIYPDSVLDKKKLDLWQLSLCPSGKCRRGFAVYNFIGTKSLKETNMSFCKHLNIDTRFLTRGFNVGWSVISESRWLKKERLS